MTPEQTALAAAERLEQELEAAADYLFQHKRFQAEKAVRGAKSQLAVLRAALGQSQKELARERALKVELGLRVGKILGPDFDGVPFDEVARQLAALRVPAPPEQE